MLLSVVIPVYNAERFLKRCLDSVFAAGETLKAREAGSAVEVICVDDGSTDGSLAVLRNYGRSVVVLSQANRGQGPARDAGLARATGDCVTFVDSDDFVPAHAFAFLVRAAVESDAPVVSSMSFAKDVETIDEPSFAWQMRRASQMAGEKVQYSVCGKLFRRELLRGRRFLPCVFEDFAYATEVFCDIDRFAAIREPLYVYCSNAGSASTIRSKLTESKVAASFSVIRHVLEWAKGKPAMPFALRQAADGLSSTIGQVYKSCDPALAAAFRPQYRELTTGFPALTGRLTIKARYRLWRLGK